MKTGTCPLPSSPRVQSRPKTGQPPGSSRGRRPAWGRTISSLQPPSPSTTGPQHGGRGVTPRGWVPRLPRGSCENAGSWSRLPSFYFTKFLLGGRGGPISDFLDI